MPFKFMLRHAKKFHTWRKIVQKVQTRKLSVESLLLNDEIIRWFQQMVKTYHKKILQIYHVDFYNLNKVLLYYFGHNLNKNMMCKFIKEYMKLDWIKDSYLIFCKCKLENLKFDKINVIHSNCNIRKKKFIW